MKIRAFSLGLLLATFTFSIQAATVVGKISFAKGSNAASQPNEAPRLLGKDSEVYQGDNIQTSDGSFVIVDFVDGSKVTIRPNSNFTVEQFDSANKNAKLKVHEGAVRASTGEFAKAGGDNFQIQTPDSTVKGVQGSEYSIKVGKSLGIQEGSVAKIVDIKGNVYAQNRTDKNAEERKLSLGSSVNEHDFLTSEADSYALMVFKDNEKVTLLAKSELDIVKYNYQKPGKKDQILFKLATGGLRVLTGNIGKKDHSAYALDTPVATIGIRGSGGVTGVVMDAEGNLFTEHQTEEGVMTMTTHEFKNKETFDNANGAEAESSSGTTESEK